jgi:hypothetical protein
VATEILPGKHPLKSVDQVAARENPHEMVLFDDRKVAQGAGAHRQSRYQEQSGRLDGNGGMGHDVADQTVGQGHGASQRKKDFLPLARVSRE